MRLKHFFLVAVWLAGGWLTAQAQFLNGIAAIVDDSVVTVRDVRMLIAPVLDLLERQYANQPQMLAQKQQETLEDGINQLVERRLILSDFKKTGGTIPDSIIDEEINRTIRERFGDRLTLTKTLQAEGMTFESYRKETRERILVDALRAKNISSEIIVSPFKIEAYYTTNHARYQVEDQVKLRMIQIKQPAGAAPGATRKMAGEVLSKIRGGATFIEMANVYHEGSQKGGEWGWVERSVLRKELADVAFALPVGSASDVIETADSCYLMLVEEKRPAHVRPLGEIREEIEKSLLLEERARLQKKWIERLRKKIFVRYF